MMKIMRYLTIEKFGWLLSDNGIFLGSAGAQSDLNEGVYDPTYIRRLVEAHPEKYVPAQLLHENIDKDDLDKFSADMMQISRERQYLCSWFAGDSESAEMWRNYAPDGVAIISEDMLIDLNMPQPVRLATHMLTVTYNSKKKQTEIHNPLAVKDDKYSYENEFRIIFNPQIFSIYTGFNVEKFGECFIGGKRTFEHEEITQAVNMEQIDDALNFVREKGDGYLFLYPLNKIITEIRISPYCTAEQEQEIKAIMNDSGLKVPLGKSSISE